MAADVARLLELCEDALPLDGDARAAFLDRACGGDVDLRRAVEALLAEEVWTRDFLETPPLGAGQGRVASGTRLGPYEIQSLIGAGAMGEVYRARDTRLGRTVALKVLPPGLARDPDRRARFRHEGQAVSALNHPHICTLHDVGSDAGLEYLVMEFLEGETLAARLVRGPLPVGEGIDIAVQMADALASAHANGLIHRDLKPANVMMTRTGAKLLDFGIAKAMRPMTGTAHAPSLTGEGLIVGTVAYMAPEQLRGAAVDARSDIFSFGAVLYEMFTGRRAFPGVSQTSVIAAILENDPPPISTLQPAAPPSIDALVRRCLAKDAAARWQSAGDVVGGLRRIQTGAAAAVHEWQRPRWRPRRGPLVVALILAIALAGGLALRNMRSGMRSPTPVPGTGTDAVSAPLRSGFARDADVLLTAVTQEPGAESFPSLAPDGREFVYASGPLDYFGESDIYRRDIGLERAFNLTPDSPGADTHPAFSPDGSLIAFRSDRDGGGIFLMRKDGTAVRRVAPQGYNPAWSPDGREIVYSTVHTMASPYANHGVSGALWIVNVETGARRQLVVGNAAQPSWSPHGYRVAYWAGSRISTCAPDGRHAAVAVDAAAPGSFNWNPVWSPDGNYLYFISDRNGPMHLWRVRIDERSGRPLDRPERTPVQMPSTFIAHPSFDASGERLLFASVPVAASILRADFEISSGTVRGNLRPVTTGSLEAVWPEPSPDGTRLAFQTRRDTESIYVSGADGGHPRSVVSGRGIFRGPHWSRDGKRLAFYSSRGGRGNVWVVDADGGNPRQVTKAGDSPIIFPSWSPDGRLAASESRPGSRSFIFNPDRPWDEAHNVLVLPPPAPDLQFVPWSWSPTGDRLAGFVRRTSETPAPPRGGIFIFTLATGTYTSVREAGMQPTPVWLPDGRRLLYAVNNAIRLLDLRTGRSREVLNVGTGRVEAAAGGGFSISAATGELYVAPVIRDGDIWFARPRELR